jgi:hypothetical protein
MKTLTIFIVLILLPPVYIAADIYFNRDYEFSITFPEGWVIKKSGNPETIVKAIYHDSTGRLAYIAIASYNWPAEFKFADVTANDMFIILKGQYSDLTINRIGSGETTIRSNRAVWNMIDVSKPPQAAMLAKHYHIVKNKHLYRISAVTDRDYQFFKKQLPIMEKAIGTLAFGL